MTLIIFNNTWYNNYIELSIDLILQNLRKEKRFIKIARQMHTSKKTKQRIIDIAINLFTERGYENVSIKDICSKLNFGRSTFYYHFKTKEQILSEYYNSESVYNTDNMSWILSAPTNYERTIRIQLVYENHISSIGNDEAIIHFITSGLTTPTNEYNSSFDKVRKLLIPVIEQCQASREIKNQTPATQLCEVALQIQSGIILQYFLMKNKDSRTDALINSLNILYNPEL